jgi:hypothetical protein
MTIRAPYFVILESTARCHACGTETPVAAIAVPPETAIEDDEYPVGPNEHGWLGLSNIERLPADVLSKMATWATGLRRDFTVTSGMSYECQHCACGAKLGDFYLHRPGGPFFGDETDGLRITRVDRPLEVEASYSEGPLDLWIEEQVTDPHNPESNGAI